MKNVNKFIYDFLLPPIAEIFLIAFQKLIFNFNQS